MERRCSHCRAELTGRRRVFCSSRCSKRAFRRRRAGVPESAYPEGALRGRVPMGEATAREYEAERLRVAFAAGISRAHFVAQEFRKRGRRYRDR